MDVLKRIRSGVARRAKVHYRKSSARMSGISFLSPDYLFIGKFDASRVIIDAGCGFDADLSFHLIKRYGLTSFALDPTERHPASLQRLERESEGKFKHLKFVLGSFDGETTFQETLDNTSGSLLTGLQNVLNDRISTYAVRTISAGNLPRTIGKDRIDYLKLDLEGAEYELLAGLTASDLMPFDQIFVEFHHHCVKLYSFRDTEPAVSSFVQKGFEVFSLDDHDYLFSRCTRFAAAGRS
jgi:FkbM family methyltransferase